MGQRLDLTLTSANQGSDVFSTMHVRRRLYPPHTRSSSTRISHSVYVSRGGRQRTKVGAVLLLRYRILQILLLVPQYRALLWNASGLIDRPCYILCRSVASQQRHITTDDAALSDKHLRRLPHNRRHSCAIRATMVRARRKPMVDRIIAIIFLSRIRQAIYRSQFQCTDM